MYSATTAALDEEARDQQGYELLGCLMILEEHDHSALEFPRFCLLSLSLKSPSFRTNLNGEGILL